MGIYRKLRWDRLAHVDSCDHSIESSPCERISPVGEGAMLVHMHRTAPTAGGAEQRPTQRRKGVRWLLLLPYLGLVFPPLYARNVPTLWGFPFFYWYQLLWVILASIVMGVVYRSIRD